MTDEQIEKLIQTINNTMRCTNVESLISMCKERHERLEKEQETQNAKISILESCINKNLLSIHRWLIGVMTTTVLTLFGLLLSWVSGK